MWQLNSGRVVLKGREATSLDGVAAAEAEFTTVECTAAAAAAGILKRFTYRTHNH
jgi:hypothetical protein